MPLIPNFQARVTARFEDEFADQGPKVQLVLMICSFIDDDMVILGHRSIPWDHDL